MVREGDALRRTAGGVRWNHSLATLTDCLNLAAMFEGELQARPVLQGMWVVSQTEVGRPIRPLPAPINRAAR